MTTPQVWLDDWAVHASKVSPYSAPETIASVLSGKVSGHPRFKDGHVITTSPIISTKGSTIETENTIYRLGLAHPNYKHWLLVKGIEYNPDNPVRMNA